MNVAAAYINRSTVFSRMTLNDILMTAITGTTQQQISSQISFLSLFYVTLYENLLNRSHMEEQ